MQYANLTELINNSTSCRSYFLSLPIKTRLLLHEHGRYIHSAADMRARVYEIEKYKHAVEISESLTLPFMDKNIR